MKRLGFFCSLVFFLSLLIHPNRILAEDKVFSRDKLQVFVSILPQKYFVEMIGGSMVDVKVMVSPGESPATYEPSPSQMTALSRAALYFSVGVPFERTWLPKIAAINKNMRMVPTDHGIEKLPMDTREDHHHGKTEHPAHPEGETGIPDPHIWTSPPLVMLQARAILSALEDVAPENRRLFEKGYRKLMNEIMDIDAHLRETFARNKGGSFMVFHPSWGYFAHTYGLTQVAVEMEGKDPKPSQLKKLITSARKQGITIVFVQPQFSSRSAKLIAREIKGSVAFADPLAPDWSGNLKEVAGKFREAAK